MGDDSALDRVSAQARSMLQDSGQDLTKLPAEFQVVLMVESAQAIIDNGGLSYFFECDFPGRPSYDSFVDAYREIGAANCALVLSEAISLFGFTNPHLDAGRRNTFLDQWTESGNDPLELLTDRICGNREVWRRLESFSRIVEQSNFEDGGSG